ncbi:NADPH-dependent D-xylose reductase [Wickerhamomyces ciferrii]|uniref:NADPH-dependent D-xylose reductase n=1 Tax=Wickerhamomyces ciferrii (strain ATCC 14091 / BCRC 22168 / CBS 111 / JCM 3599 / NBRC 0793 / NRRL Y-1031 F-60-10) TaxID=1206466 RepID=K0KLP2_WICCF|nr:NADPH-dependent D-xylose reductase [Wickerhamomyces ciferrii]CCH43137.1 NADPH-dependent D-xylose reductase [Wickerhamomyces ciferrii]
MSSVVTLNDGNKLPLVGLGLWKIPNETASDQVYQAIKQGYRAFDGATDYGNEKEVGLGFKKAIDEGLVKREDLVVITKLWNTFHHPDNVVKNLNKNLEDLGVDYIDLYYIHFPIAQKFIPIEEQYPPHFGTKDYLEFEDVPILDTWRALEKLVEAGKIKSLGISNFSGALIQDLLRGAKIKPVALQIEHHPYLVQDRLVEYAQKQGIQVVAYSSFGPLSFVDLGQDLAKSTPPLFENDTILNIAKKHGKTPSQILLRWATQRGIAVIPKSSNPERLLQNLTVEDFDLTEGELKEISGLDKNLRFNDPYTWSGSGYKRLEKSRSHRIAWLLEELNLEYTLKLYHRAGGVLAPPELKKIFPLGKSPILELNYDNGSKPIILAESGHIINYLIENFDSEGKLTPSTPEGKQKVDYYLHFSEGTLGSHLTYVAVHNVGVSKAPFYVRPIISGFVGKLNELYGFKEIKACVEFLESELSKESKNNTSSSQEIFLVENKLTGADVILWFNIHILLESGRVEGLVRQDYPSLSKWLTQMNERKGLKDANEKIETLGEGEYPV